MVAEGWIEPPDIQFSDMNEAAQTMAIDFYWPSITSKGWMKG
jgi:hypothetical protein